MTKPPGQGEVASSSEGEACLGALDPSELSNGPRRSEGMNAMRICKDCGIEQPEDDFPKRGNGGRYRLYRCKACHKVFRRRYNTMNRTRPQTVGEITAAPLVEWLQDLVKQAGGPGPVAKKVGLNERALWRLLHGQQFVHETLADRVFCAAGQPQLFYILYGDLYDERDAA